MNSSSHNLGKPKLPSGIVHYHEPDTDVVTWSNQDLPIHILSFVLWPTGLFLIPIFLTWLLRQDFVEALPILAPAWLIALFLATLIFRRYFWKEMVVISDRSITLTRTGFFAPKEKRFQKENVLRISYEKYDPWRGGEILYSLNIVYRHKLLGVIPGIETEQLAFLARKRELYQLFLYLQIILEERGWRTMDERQSRQRQRT